MKKNAFLISAPASNQGKTSVTLSVIEHFKHQGKKVQTFKCGPDFIDPMLHEKLTGNPSVNLDSTLSSARHIQHLFYKHMNTADIGIVEGMMGLFDGAADDYSGSTAEIATILDLPVILVLDAESSGYGISALLYGFKCFDPNIKIMAVIFNRVAGEGHYKILEASARKVGLRTLGYITRNDEIRMDSRHLGLKYESVKINQLYAHFKTHLKLEHLHEFSEIEIPEQPSHLVHPTKQWKIAIAKDEAFNFIYHENIAVLDEFAELTFFSALKNEAVPDCDLLYLPGGYPELFLERLSGAQRFRKSVLNHVQAKKKVFAECGGMMVLGKSIRDPEGIEYSMCGILKQTFDFQQATLSIGYRKLVGKQRFQGMSCMAQEFRFSDMAPVFSACEPFEISDLNTANKTPVYFDGTVFASYCHFYWAERKSFLRRFLMNSP